MINKLMKSQRGQGMTEYVIILVSIAVVCIAIAVQFGGKIQELFETADTEIDTVDANLQAAEVEPLLAMLGLCLMCAYIYAASSRRKPQSLGSTVLRIFHRDIRDPKVQRNADNWRGCPDKKI